VNRAFVPIGSDLHRPECVLATYRGDLFSSDSRGGVMHIRPDRSQVLLTGRTAELPNGIAPNGIALQPDGSFLLAHVGEQDAACSRCAVTDSSRLAPRP
jgi:hypothetical protein